MCTWYICECNLEYDNEPQDLEETISEMGEAIEIISETEVSFHMTGHSIAEMKGYLDDLKKFLIKSDIGGFDIRARMYEDLGIRYEYTTDN